jgi:hypothetical protein
LPAGRLLLVHQVERTDSSTFPGKRARQIRSAY